MNAGWPRLFAVLSGILLLSGCAHPPPPLMPAYNPQADVEICAGGVCGKAGETFALEDIAAGISKMFAANGPGVWKFCTANRSERRCIQDQLSYTVNGPIPATGFVPGGAVRSGAKYDGQRSVHFDVNIPTIVFDKPSVCDDARSNLSVRSTRNIFWQSTPYMCSWGGTQKTIVAEGQYGIDYIDFDRGIMGGEFAIRVSGGGNGFKTGYAVTSLSIGMRETQEAWLKPINSAQRIASGPAPGQRPQQPSPPRTNPSAPMASSFPQSPLNISFRKGPARPDDVAVIIGNADYSKLGRDIPNVVPAYADAESFKQYAMTSLGVREGNIIDLRDATSAQFSTLFGTESDYMGRLYNWTKPGVSNLTIYYAGHGAPAARDGSALLVPADADASAIHLTGYPLSRLYRNLSKIPAKSITVVLEACFSGAGQGGSLVSNASPVFMNSKAPEVPPNITVIAAGGANQMASWEEDQSHGLFTKYYLMGMSGEADKGRSGNKDGNVSIGELEAYLSENITYFARRYYGRDQTVVIKEAR